QADKAKAAHGTAIRILTASADAVPPPQINYELARTYFHLAKLAVEPPGPPVPFGQRGPGEGKGPKGGPKGKGKGDKGPPKGPPDSKKRPWTSGRAEAEQYLSKAVQLLKQLAHDQPTAPAYRHLLALCYREKSALPSGPFPK